MEHKRSQTARKAAKGRKGDGLHSGGAEQSVTQARSAVGVATVYQTKGRCEVKSVMLSIQPKWCELIANGKKTIEVRKTRPKLETPYKCYIYCMLPPRSELFHHGCIYEYAHELLRLQDGRIVYDYGMRLSCENGEYSKDNFLCKKVIGEFVCDNIDEIIPDYNPQLQKFFYGYVADLKPTCLSEEELREYAGIKPLYFWHISDLKIYDKPKELGDFYTVDMDAVMSCKYRERIYVNPDFVNGAKIKGGYICDKDDTDWCRKCLLKPLTRPPQSWCYVEEL